MKNSSYKEIQKRLIRAAKAKKFPLMGHFELTARCNLDCKMCYVHTQDNATALKKELSTDQWKHIFDEAYECGLQYASLSGGECLLRSDFKELYLHLWNKKVYVTVMSNGTMLNSDYVQFFKMYQPDMIQISLYGSTEDGYLNVAGHKGFEKAFNAILELEKAGIDVRVAITPSKYMTDDYIETIKLCRKHKLQLVLNDIVLLENRDDPSKNDYYLSIDEVVDLSIKRSELNRQLEPASCVPNPCGSMDCEQPKGLTCNGGNCLATISYEGKMYPCVNAMIGGFSLLEMSYKEAWDKTVNETSNLLLSIECVGCPYDKVCPKCAAIRLKDMKSGHCNPEICELNKRLVEAGVKTL